MLKLLLGRNQDQISEAVLRAAAERVPGRRSLVIVPEQYSHVTERRLCAIGGDSISARAEVLTFSRLAQRVFQEKGGSARPVLDKGGRLLLMHLAVRRLRGELNVYRQAGEKAGFLTSLLATADECKSYCIPPELLLEAGESEPERGRRLRELGLVLGAYDALTAQRAEDPRDKLSRLADTLRGTDYFRGKAVFLDGFTDFTPQERLVLGVMLRQSELVTAGLRCDTLDMGGASVFNPVRHTALALTSPVWNMSACPYLRCWSRSSLFWSGTCSPARLRCLNARRSIFLCNAAPIPIRRHPKRRRRFCALSGRRACVSVISPWRCVTFPAGATD